jgi:DNA-binding NarL/FixJ family response regulator
MSMLVAYQHRLLRDSIRPLLAEIAGKTVLYEATTFDEAVQSASEHGEIELALLGDELPGLDGLAGIRLFRHQFPTIKLVMLTEGLDPVSVMAAIDCGMAGVIFKSISAKAMVAALKLVLEGEIYFPSLVIGQISALCAKLAPAPALQPGFSPGEIQVVPLLLSGLCNKVIGNRLGIEEAAVKARLRGIYKKMGVVNRAQAVMALMSDHPL